MSVCIDVCMCVSPHVHMHMCMDTKINQHLNAECGEIDANEDFILINDQW